MSTNVIQNDFDSDSDIFKELIKQPKFLKQLKRFLDEEEVDDETRNCQKRLKFISQNNNQTLISMKSYKSKNSTIIFYFRFKSLSY